MKTRVIEIIREVAQENGKHEGVEIIETTNLRTELNFDSLDLAVLTVKIEDEFDVDIFEEGNVQTIGDILTRLSSEEK